MKVRMLSALPHHRALKSGVVYDLADGEHFVNTGEAEEVDAKEKAEADPRVAAEADAGEAEGEAKPAARSRARKA